MDTATPVFDWHALAPEIVIAATIAVVLVSDLFARDRSAWRSSRIASVGLLAALIPIATLAIDGTDRVMFGGAYVVDGFALVMKGFFVLGAYVTILISIDEVAEGDYYRGEYYFLLLVSVLGMTFMASARDLLSLFVALETVSIPTYVLAGFRKHDRRSNEAAIKYYLIGVLSSALMLYGMSFVFGITGTTLLSGIAEFVAVESAPPLLAVAIFLSMVGFAFKVSAVPFHFWAPDTYEGAPIPVTAYLSVSSKAAGFVGLLAIVFFGFLTYPTGWGWVVWVLAAASMTLGNLAALRQTRMVRMLAYSSIAQGGFLLVPIAAAGADTGSSASALSAVVVYLLVYGVMNFGAFAVVIALARRTGTDEISSYAGLFETSPALAVTMTMFLASLAGVPPLAGWFAKFVMFGSVFSAGTASAVVLGVIAALNSVVAFFYYSGPIRQMFFESPAEGARGPVRVPVAITAAIVMTAVVVLAAGVYPQVFARLGDAASEALRVAGP